MVELEDVRVVDIHCFALPETPQLTVQELTRFFLYGGPTVKSISPTQLNPQPESYSLRYFLKNLAAFLGCEAKLESVIEARRRRAKDFWDYVNQLFSDAKIEAVVLDDGLYQEAIGQMTREAPCKTYRVMRIEPLIDQLLTTANTYTDLIENYTRRIEEATTLKGFKGYKSVIAYRTGLNIGSPNEEEAKRDFEAAKSGQATKSWYGYQVKNLRDHLFTLTAQSAAKHKAILQTHTGLGDTDIVGQQSNPILLQETLKQEPLKNTNLILIHGGYPYTEEAAWMAHSYPNVYTETSTPIPPIYHPPLSNETLTKTLQIAPTTKIVYGSDGHGLPELIWLSAKTIKKELAKTLNNFINQGLITQKEAAKWAQMILNQNATQLLDKTQPK
ncbi:MAG: amidohydrolase family protein [Thermoprotei archaeon]